MRTRQADTRLPSRPWSFLPSRDDHCPGRRVLRSTVMHPGALVGGKYRLTRFLGEGAMGSVWAAVQLETQQQVAVKLIAGPEILAEELRSRLLREAQAC